MADAAQWCGWHKRTGAGEAWRIIETADTYEVCWRKLLRLPLGGEVLVLPAGQEPAKQAIRLFLRGSRT